MAIHSAFLILISVLLAATAQVCFKYGMSRTDMQQAVGGGAVEVLMAMIGSPAIIAGFTAYGLSTLLWLGALAKVDLSFAYPFVALGIVITTFAGAWLFSEPVTPLRLAGTALICTGVVLVAASQSGG